jgi:manganese transport protein
VSVKNVLAVALGIMSAIGGFVDIGDLVFNTQAGSIFGFQLLWVVVIGVVGIIVYSEMCGRVSAVAERPVFDLVRERTGFGAGLATLVASEVVNLMTCAAEIGGVAICFQLLSGLPYRLLIPLAVLGLAVSSWVLPFRWIERVFGYLGLGLLVFAVAAIKLHPDWGQVAHGFVPGSHSGGSLMVYLYFVVGLLGAAMTPYEVYFYSSGVVEDRWGLKELRLNQVTAIIGYALGGFLSFALMIVAGVLFLPRGISPSSWARRRSPPSMHWAKWGCCWRSSASSSLSAARPSRPPSLAPTTWPSSSAGGGARRSGRPGPRASRSPGWRSSPSPSWS